MYNDQPIKFNGETFYRVTEYRKEVFKVFKAGDTGYVWDMLADYEQANNEGMGCMWAQEMLEYDTLGVTAEKDIERLRRIMEKHIENKVWEKVA